MWKAVIFLGCAFGTLYATPIGLKNMPIGEEQQNNEKTEVAMSTLNLPSNATSIRAVISDEFTCENKTYGYYADVDNDCQIFHVCLPVTYPDGKENTFRWSFICPEETLFSQESFTCVREVDMNFNCDESERFYELNRNFGINPDSSIEMTSFESNSDGYERRHDESSTKKVISHKNTKPTNTVEIPQRRPISKLDPELKPKVHPARHPKPSLKEEEVPIPIYVRRPQLPKETPLVPVAVKTLEEDQTEKKEDTAKDNQSVETLSPTLLPNMENSKTDNLPKESETVKYESQPTTEEPNMIPEESETQKIEEIPKTEEILGNPAPTESIMITDAPNMVKGIEQEMQLASSDSASISVLQPEPMDSQTELSLKLDIEKNSEDMPMLSTPESLMDSVEKQEIITTVETEKEMLTSEEQKTVIVDNISNLVKEESSKTPEEIEANSKISEQLAEEFVMLGENNPETPEKSDMPSSDEKKTESKKVEEEIVPISIENTDTAPIMQTVTEIKMDDSGASVENEISELKEPTLMLDKIDMEQLEMITEKTVLEEDKIADMEIKVIQPSADEEIKSEESVPKLAEDAKLESDKSSQEVVNDIKNILQAPLPVESDADKKTVVLTHDPIDVESISIKNDDDKTMPLEQMEDKVEGMHMIVETHPMFLKEESNALSASVTDPLNVDKTEHIPAEHILPPFEVSKDENLILKDEIEKITDTVSNESDEAIVVEKASEEIITADIKEEPIKTEDNEMSKSDENINEEIIQETMTSTAEGEIKAEEINEQPMRIIEQPIATEEQNEEEIKEIEVMSQEPMRTEPEKVDEVPVKLEEIINEEIKMEPSTLGDDKMDHMELNENIEPMAINKKNEPTEKIEATPLNENMENIPLETISTAITEKADTIILNEKIADEKIEPTPSQISDEPKEEMSDQTESNTNEEAIPPQLKLEEPLEAEINKEQMETHEEMSVTTQKLDEPINEEIIKKTLETEPISDQPQPEIAEISSTVPDVQTYVEPNNEPLSNLVKSHTFSVEEESPITMILDEIVNEVVAAVQNDQSFDTNSSIEPEPISVSSETKVELKTDPIVEEPIEKNSTDEKLDTLPNEFEMKRRRFPDPDPNPVDDDQLENTSSNLVKDIPKFQNSNLETSDVNAAQQSEISARSIHRRMDPRKRRFLFRSESHSR